MTLMLSGMAVSTSLVSSLSRTGNATYRY